MSAEQPGGDTTRGAAPNLTPPDWARYYYQQDRRFALQAKAAGANRYSREFNAEKALISKRELERYSGAPIRIGPPYFLQ